MFGRKVSLTLQTHKIILHLPESIAQVLYLQYSVCLVLDKFLTYP